MLSQSADGAVNEWSPLHGEVELAGSLSYDLPTEFGLGAQLRAGDERSLLVIPRVRLVRPTSTGMKYYGVLGIPGAFSPDLMVGLELGGGALYSINEAFELLGSLQIDTLFALAPLPRDDSVFMINASVGGRMVF